MPTIMCDSETSKFPTDCELKKYENKICRLVCSSLNGNFSLNYSSKVNDSHICTYKTSSKIYFRLNRPQILERSLDLLSISKFSIATFNSTKILISDVNGFDVGPPKITLYDFNREIEMEFYFVDFKFYLNQILIDSCNGLNASFETIFQLFRSSILKLGFYDVRFPTKTCQHLFDKNSILSIDFNSMINTFYKVNVLKFDRLENSSIKSMIQKLSIYDMEKIDIDSSLLNNRVFENIKSLTIGGEVISIELGLLKSFKSLRSIYFQAHYIRRLFHRGIDWIQDLNCDLSVDLTTANKSLSDKYITLNLAIAMKSNNYNPVLSSTSSELFPNEDFCLYEKFPFRQLIILFFTKLNMNNSCTYKWLTQYYYYYRLFLPDSRINSNLSNIWPKLIEECNFKQRYLLKFNKIVSIKYISCFIRRLDYCKKSNFSISTLEPVETFSDFRERLNLAKFALLILTPVICFLGIVSNLLIIYTVSYKPNEKDLKERQYKYMRLNSASNTLILLIASMNMINECDYVFFCSNVRRSLVSQYFKIVFAEYFMNLLRLVSNFTYVGFAINRLSLIGKNHAKIILSISNMSVKKFFLIILIPSSLLPIVKIFRFRINTLDPEEVYPIPFGYIFTNHDNAKLFSYFSFNFFYDFVNSFAFWILNLIIDIVLVIKLKSAIDQKAENKTNKSNECKK